MVKSENKTIYNIIKHNDNQFYIPIFQRIYRWPKAKRGKFYEDIMRKSNVKNIDFNSVYINHLPKPEGELYGQTQIVDGQQRLTTYLILVTATCAYSKHNNVENNWEEILYYSLLINRAFSKEDDRRFKLKLKEKDNEFFKKLITDLPKPAEIKGKISLINQAYQQAYSFIKDNSDNLLLIINNLTTVNATESVLEMLDDPQECFENANDDSETLTIDERVCSTLIFKSGESEIEQENIFYKYWNDIDEYFGTNVRQFESFLQSIAQIKTNNYTIGITEYIKENIVTQKESIAFLKEINHYFGIYKKIRDADIGIIPINESLEFINAKSSSFVLSSIIKILDLFNAGDISEECCINCVKIFETHIMRCWILNKSATDCIRSVFDLSKFEDRIVSLDYYLMHQIESEGYFVSDNEFGEKLKYYKFKSNSAPKSILLRIINYNYSEERFTLLNTSTEHIMPKILSKEWISDLGEDYKTIHETYLNTICNLTLLPKRNNSSLSNLSFIEKLYHEKGYVNSRVPLNQKLEDFKLFSKRELETRGDYLVKIALEIWCYPPLVNERSIQSHLDEITV